jgi:carbonic anhydrase
MNGAQSEAEIHIVSETDDKKLIVIGVFIDEGPENAALKTLLALRPDADCTSRKALTPNFNVMRLLPPSTTAFFNYSGSLTTPACDEIATWIVMRDHITASRAQLDALKVHHENARPPQPLGGRVVQKNF